MPREKKTLFPKHQRLLGQLGERIRLSRLRRRLTATQVSERAGISRNTLHRLEQGDASCSIATLFMVLMVVGQELDFELLAKDDVLGRKLQDIELMRKSS